MLKWISFVLTLTLIGASTFQYVTIQDRHEKIEPSFIENELLVYYIKHTQVRNRHYMLPHTTVRMHCPECGDLQKIGTMELETVPESIDN